MTGPGRKPVILAVDDEPDVLELVTYRLSHSGYDVLEARNGEQALELADGQPPDLAVIDVMMPGLNGIEVMARLRAAEATRQMPVILLTARIQETDVARGFEAGADDYLKKPFNPGELVSRIGALLARR